MTHLRRASSLLFCIDLSETWHELQILFGSNLLLLIMATYSSRLEATKKNYPFHSWQRFEELMPQYNLVNCSLAAGIVDRCIEGLIGAGEDASEERKLDVIKSAVFEYNELNTKLDDSFIETGEREDLCNLFETIAVAAGIDVSKYDCDVTGEWREW